LRCVLNLISFHRALVVVIVAVGIAAALRIFLFSLSYANRMTLLGSATIYFDEPFNYVVVTFFCLTCLLFAHLWAQGVTESILKANNYFFSRVVAAVVGVFLIVFSIVFIILSAKQIYNPFWPFVFLYSFKLFLACTMIVYCCVALYFSRSPQNRQVFFGLLKSLFVIAILFLVFLSEVSAMV
jgi:cytochrome bd-type quinol oxidase subunit 2